MSKTAPKRPMRFRSAYRTWRVGAVAAGALLAAAAPGLPVPLGPARHDSTATGTWGYRHEIDSAAAPNPYGPYIPPPQRPQPERAPLAGGTAEPNGSRSGIPTIVLLAYETAERSLASNQPGCHLRWWMLAAIGQVESGQARGGQVDARGTTRSPILGPRLDGTNRYAAIADTDHGRWDGDTAWDRAVGPMQFIPSTWRRFGVDANNDGIADPNNVLDAATAAGRYLCADGRDLSDPTQLAQAIFSYNPSPAYVQNVLSWARAYASGMVEIPDNTAVLAASTGHSAPGGATSVSNPHSTPRAAPTQSGSSRADSSQSGSPRQPAASPPPSTSPPPPPSTSPHPPRLCSPTSVKPLPTVALPLPKACLPDVTTLLGVDPAKPAR